MAEEQKFENDNEAGDNDQDGGDSDSDDKRKGRRKIDISFIENKSRRHITFSKRKAGIMKKAYELATLTGTQVLLLVASETGHVYTFATPKLQPLITNPEGKNLIQACLNAPDQSAPEPPKPIAAPAPVQTPQAYAATPEPDRSKAFAQGYPQNPQQSPQMGYDPKGQYVRPKPEPMRQMEDPRNNIGAFPPQNMGIPPMQGHPGAIPGYPGMPPAQYQNSQFFQPRQGPQGQQGPPMQGFPGQGQPQQQQGQGQMQHPGAMPMGQAPMYGNYGRPQQQQQQPQGQPQMGFPQMYQLRPQMHQDQGGQDGQDGSEDD